MIRSLTIKNYLGESIFVDLMKPQETGLAVLSITGLGPPKANINTTEVSTNDGSIFNSSRLNPRNIVITFSFLGSPTIEDTRQKTYKYFPIKKEVEIIITTDNRIARTSGYVESNEPTIFSKQEGAVISIICPDSYYYDESEDGSGNFMFGSLIPLFEFPFSNESLTEPLIEFSSIDPKPSMVINYKGDSEIGFKIIINSLGACGDITLYNLGTRESMEISNSRIETLTGSRIKYGDQITVSTIKGDKYVRLLRDGEEINILNSLERNSTWFKLSKGDNILAYTSDVGSENLQVRVVYNSIFEGI